MLVVKIDLHPFGDESKAKNIGNVLIWNKGGDRTTGHYGVAVLPEGMEVKEGRRRIRNGETNPLKVGEVRDYARLDNPVEQLVAESLASCGFKV